MHPKHAVVSVALLLAASAVWAQSGQPSSSLRASESEGGAYRPTSTVQNGPVYGGPFSRFSIGGGIGTLGPGVQLTTILNPHLNLRLSAQGLHYTTSFTTNGFNANARLNLVSAGISADVYPFHNGFRLSPGLLFLNNNRVAATSVATPGTSFDFNDTTYYSAYPNPVTGATPLHADGNIGLSSTRPAFTITTGWGNTIPRYGRWSFPVEVGVALIGSPSIDVALSGWACQDQAQTQCGDVQDPANSTSADIQSNLNAQLAKWRNDLDPLKTYPIVSFGVAYSFVLRGGGTR